MSGEFSMHWSLEWSRYFSFVIVFIFIFTQWVHAAGNHVAEMQLASKTAAGCIVGKEVKLLLSGVVIAHSTAFTPPVSSQ